MFGAVYSTHSTQAPGDIICMDTQRLFVKTRKRRVRYYKPWQPGAFLEKQERNKKVLTFSSFVKMNEL